ncbi:MAG TPA: PD-(D/E)XK nuclease family protein [Burkholderiaceae bacterium]|mgnify:CR=1 FL=1|nr:PD-(D/E)XK nuclease family protein [Burkholderiaceae bacterium]
MPESKSTILKMPELSPQIAAYWRQICQQIHVNALAQGVHLSRCVVLLPFAQLLPVARHYWSVAFPDGFVPQFFSTKIWAKQFGGFQLASHDISFEATRDILTAAHLLQQSGLVGKRSANHSYEVWDKNQIDLLAPKLVDIAHQISVGFAAIHPNQRLALAEQLRIQPNTAGSEATVQDWLRLENGLAQVAIAWAATSRYASDVLFDTESVKAKVDMVMVVPGFQRDALAQNLMALWQQDSPDSAVLLPGITTMQSGQINVYKAQNVLDEAKSSAACVLRHLRDGRFPVALVANDRALTRRVHALLRDQGIRIKDENGWKLSTTRAAATVMSSLSACSHRASSDQVLDWLKNSAFLENAEIVALEKTMRRKGVARWQDWVRFTSDTHSSVYSSTQKIESLRLAMQGTHQLSDWILHLQQLLRSSLQWDVICTDQAGERILAALHLKGDAAQVFEGLEQAQTRMSLSDFEKWVNLALESANFIPRNSLDDGNPQVVILPLSQLLCRPFAAVVIAGCDEVRVQSTSESNPFMTRAQQTILGLPTPEEHHAATLQAWQNALATPVCDLLWRAYELSGESLQLSSVVQRTLLSMGSEPHHLSTEQLFDCRFENAKPTCKPMPDGAQLVPNRLSSSAYEKLRNCPYQYFALQMLGLVEDDELVDEISKRDFGTWLHAVLNLFHGNQKNMRNQAVSGVLHAYTAMINIAADVVTQQLKLPADSFMPWASTWPKLRDGYLTWLIEHETSDYHFDQSELACQTKLGDLTLHGRIDRIDRLAATAGAQSVMLIDYKTESLKKTTQRVKEPFEDTQLAFYGALLDDDTLRAAYVNVSERETKMIEQTHIVEIRDVLIEGILDDLQRIAAGAALPALGEGATCDYCKVRGLCRKDFWNESP